MPKVTLLVAAIVLAGCANTAERSAASSEAERPQLIAACNGAADASGIDRKSMRACETLANEGRLSLVEPAAVAAYERYRQESKRREAAIQSSPRGTSRSR